MQAQISLCAKIGYMYYCEYAHLLKKCTEHTCMSNYYDQSSNIKADKCKAIVTFDTLPESKILDAGSIFPISRILRGTHRTDLFVEVTNLTKGNTKGAHYTSSGYYPT